MIMLKIIFFLNIILIYFLEKNIFQIYLLAACSTNYSGLRFPSSCMESNEARLKVIA
jgi:hypothetical protein